MLDTIRRTTLSTEASAAITSVKTMQRTVTESLWQRRLWGALFAAFAALVLILAAVGIYGVISYAVAQRTREHGVRLALGARPAELQRLVVGEGMTLCGIGALVGALVAFGFH
ncbi:MAG: FtsX-like permease family protein [Vicinamibacterales bacterium]